MENENTKPENLVKQWVTLFNAGNAVALAELYHENAINHQVANAPVYGKASILDMFQKEFELASMHCIIQQVLVDGEWAILEWKDPTGLQGCGFFQVRNGKIVLQRGYWDKLSFLRLNQLPLPKE